MGSHQFSDHIIPGRQERLVAAMARRMGFRPDEIPDAQQEVALQLLGIEHGQTQRDSAILVGVIARNVLSKMQRSNKRYVDRLERYRHLLPIADAVEDPDPDRGELWAIIEAEDDAAQSVARLLADGVELNGIARQLGMTWERVRRIVDALAQRLRRAGFDPAMG